MGKAAGVDALDRTRGESDQEYSVVRLKMYVVGV
jgi:hypothetical protein